MTTERGEGAKVGGIGISQKPGQWLPQLPRLPQLTFEFCAMGADGTLIPVLSDVIVKGARFDFDLIHTELSKACTVRYPYTRAREITL